jgi:hypothetical protein
MGVTDMVDFRSSVFRWRRSRCSFSVNGAGEIFVKVGDRPVIYGWNLEFIGSLLLQVKQNKNNVKLFFFLEVVFTI